MRRVVVIKSVAPRKMQTRIWDKPDGLEDICIPIEDVCRNVDVCVSRLVDRPVDGNDLRASFCQHGQNMTSDISIRAGYKY